MKTRLTPTAVKSYIAASSAVRKAFDKQTGFLVDNLNHPSLWQARVNRDWRFYFTIEADTYVIHKIIPHPK